MKIAFITKYWAHYRVNTYETLAKYEDVHYIFHSIEKGWYWDQTHKDGDESIHYDHVQDLKIRQIRIPHKLIGKLWQDNYDLYFKCVNNKFALAVSYLTARLRGKPFVLWTGIWGRLHARVHHLAWPLTKYVYRHADAVAVYGIRVKQYLIEEGVRPEKIFLAPHAVKNEDYNQVVPEEAVQELRRSLDLTPDQKVVLYVGRLVKAKGLPYLLEAFSRINVPDAVLVLVGRGPEEEALRQQVKSLNIAHRVRFTGYVVPNKTVTYYAMAWVHVLPSITGMPTLETWGLVVNEAFNQGVPSIVSTAVGAAGSGLVEDGVTGFVVPERSAELLAVRLQHILCDEDLRQRLSVAARERVVHWNNEAMVAGFRAAIHYAAEQHMLKKKRRGLNALKRQSLPPHKALRGNDFQREVLTPKPGTQPNGFRRSVLHRHQDHADAIRVDDYQRSHPQDRG